MHILHFSLILAKLPLWKHFRFVQHNKKTGDALLLYSLHHRHTTSVHITTRQYKLNAVRTSAAQNMWAQREPAVAHIHIVRYKKNSTSDTSQCQDCVIKKGQGSRYNNEPSGPSSSSPPETQTLHHLQPVVYKKGEEGGVGVGGQII